MRILRLRLTNYRGIRNRSVEFAPVGVTVVQGPNEAGKSSIAEALDVLFTELDTSGKARVRSLQPKDRDVPVEIELEAQSGRYHFVYSKSFVRSRATHLRVSSPKAENISGRAAHERVQEILSETMDLDLWKAMCVQQGQSFAQADLGSATSLASALDTVAGAVPVGDREHDLFDAAHDEYRKYFSETGRPGAELKAAAQAVTDARADVDRLAHDLDALETDIERYAVLTSDVESLRARTVEAQKDAEREQSRWLAIQRMTRTVKELETELESARARLGSARDRLALRANLEAGLIALEGQRAELGRELVAQGPAFEAAEADLKKVDAQLDKAGLALRDAESLLAARQAELDTLNAIVHLDMLRERRTRITALLTEGAAAREVVAAALVDEPLLRALRKAYLEVEKANAALMAASPVLQVTAVGDVDLDLNGRTVSLSAGEEIEQAVGEESVLLVPEVLRIQIGAGRGMQTLTTRLQHAQAGLEDLLAQAQVAGLDEAEAAFGRRRAAELVLQEQDNRMRIELRDLTLEQMDERIARLEQRLHDLPMVEHRPTPQAIDDAERALEDARHEVSAAGARREELNKEKVASAARVEQLRSRRQQTDSRIGLLKQQLRQAELELANARADVADKKLGDELRSAEDVVSQAEAAYENARRELEAHDPASAEMLAGNSQQVAEDLRKQLVSLEDARRIVYGRLQARQEDGLHEHLEEARARLERTSKVCAGLERQAAAARRLYETLRDHREQARQAYVAPLRDEIVKLGRVVFGPTFSVELDQHLQIESRTLNDVTVPFTDLSAGTKEQLCLLARLACARLVAPEEGVPIVIDDALGQSDELRLRAMGATIGQVGRTGQIVILSCLADRYRHVAGAQVVRLADSAEDLPASA